MKNHKIRIALVEYNMKQYEVAALLGMRENAFTKKLRDELPEEEQNRIVKLIRENGGKE